MSSINDISQQIYDVVSFTKNSVDQISTQSKSINQYLIYLQQSMKGTSGPEYESLVSQLISSKSLLSNAITSLLNADIAGREWLSFHGGLMNPSSSGYAQNNASDAINDVSSDSHLETSFSRPHMETADGTYQKIREALDNSVNYKCFDRFKEPVSENEIINRLGGGDITEGSCSSLAFAYIGNKAGYDVLDFRGGNSLDFFSEKKNILSIASLSGVNAKVEYGKDDFVCAQTLRDSIKPEEEYYFATGRHAAIVKLDQGRYYYLELQSANDNGWKILTDSTFIDRFHCEKNSSEYPSFLIEMSSLANSKEFLDVLGYINTSESEQQKGDFGHEK